MNVIATFIVLAVIMISASSYAAAALVPEWVKNTSKWYGEGKISETEFLNAIKFLIKNKIIVLDEEPKKISTANVIIPNGNSKVANIGSYMPLNLETYRGTIVVWINEDNVEHTIVSQDDKGKVLNLFNSKALNTGERFVHKFDNEGVYHYFCTIHPWRVGMVTVR